MPSTVPEESHRALWSLIEPLELVVALPAEGILVSAHSIQPSREREPLAP